MAPTKPKDWQASFFVKFVVLSEPHEVGYSLKYTHNGMRLCCRRSVSSVCVVGRHLVDFVKYCQIKFTNQRTVQVISANQSEVTIYGNVSREFRFFIPALQDAGPT